MKRKRRDRNPDNMHNWAIVCALCGARFEDNEEIDLSEGHFAQEHPEDKPEFGIVWVGVGPPPRRGPRRRRR